MTYSDERGTYIWRYVGGKRVKIYTGQSLSEAMIESGKFPSMKKSLPVSGTSAIMQVNAQEFAKAIAEAKASLPAKHAWRVDAKDASEYEDSKCYVSKGGSCVAVKPNGDIVSVCKKAGDAVRGVDLIEHAVKNGGDRLDAFGPDLYSFYTRNGFEPVSWTPFNANYAPQGWIVGAYGKEPILFYKYTGKKSKRNFGNFLIHTAPHLGDNGYSDAMAARDGGM